MIPGFEDAHSQRGQVRRMEDVDALFSELGIEVPVASDGTFVFDEEPALKSEDVADCAGEEAEKIEEKKPERDREETTPRRRAGAPPELLSP